MIIDFQQRMEIKKVWSGSLGMRRKNIFPKQAMEKKMKGCHTRNVDIGKIVAKICGP